MKRIISFLLAISLLLAFCVEPVCAVIPKPDSPEGYLLDEFYADILHNYRHFMDQPGGWSVLTDGEAWAYNVVATNLKNNKSFMAGLDSAHFLAEASWLDVLGGTYNVDDIKVQYYVSALSSLLVTMDYQTIKIRSKQAKLTASMTWQDYVEKGASVLADLVGLDASFSGNSGFANAFDACGIAIETVTDSLETFEHYQYVLENANTFISFRTMLQVLQDHSSDKILVKAAKYLQDAVDCTFQYRMTQMSEVGGITQNTLGSCFLSVFNNVINSLDPEDFLDLEWAAFAALNNTVGLLKSIKIGIKIGMLAADVLVGGSDLIQRAYELFAMNSARETLISVIMSKDQKISSVTDIEMIPDVLDLLDVLNYVNYCGAYSVRQIIKTDGHLLTILLKSNNVDGWYDSVQNICLNIDLSLSNIIPHIEFYQDEMKEDNNLVTDAYSAKIKGEYGECDFSIPQINLPGNDVEAINKEIWDELYIGVVQKIQSQIPYVGVERINYEWSVNGNFLSLFIESRPGDWEWWDHYVYNVDISTGSRLSNIDVITVSGLSSEEYFEKTKQALGSRYWGKWEDNGNSFFDQNTVDLFNQQLHKTISDANVRDAKPYFNDAGQLCISALVYSIAGAEAYFEVINLENFKLLPYYAEDGTLSPRKIIITEEEANRIAYDYWDYAPGSKAEGTGFELFLVSDGLIQKQNGNYYYAFRLQWLVTGDDLLGDHMSTCDYLFVNAETGECTYSV